VAKPAPPTRNLALSTRSALYIEWQESLATEIEVEGYLLYMAEGLHGDFKAVYNGTANALQRHFVARELQVGQLYQFKVAAVNFNGLSEASDLLTVHACVRPSAPSAPKRVEGTSTSITLSWTAPADDGGCTLTGYKLMRDTGQGLTDPIAVEVDPLAINDRPTLTQHQVDLSSDETGLQVRFRVIAINLEETSASAIASFTIAGLPNKPPGLVTFRYAETPYLNLN